MRRACAAFLDLHKNSRDTIFHVSARRFHSAPIVAMPPKIPKRKAPEASLPESPFKKTARTTIGDSSLHETKSVFKPTLEPSRATSSKLSSEAQNGNNHRYDHSRLEEKYGIVQREFYPAEMSSERCEMYNKNEIPRPIEVLEKTIDETASARNKIAVGETVVHWFKRDLRSQDNRALHLASEKAKSKNVPLICIFMVSPQDYQAHLTSPPRVDFELRSLEVLKQDLGELDIPLFVETYEKRKQIPGHIIELCEKWGAKHLFCNIEYEVDELRRESAMIKDCLKKGISFTAVHDDIVVPPGTLFTGQGKQYAVYSPWFRSWIAHLNTNSDKLDLFEEPSRNPSSARQKFQDLFDQPIPPAPSNKSLTDEAKRRFTSLWPAGQHEANDRLSRFLDEKVGKYKDTRNFPAANTTACISVHLSAGTLSARSAVRKARDANSTRKLDGGNPGIANWISEVAWRDFYKCVLAHWPYVCMNVPFKHEYKNIEWSYDMDKFDLWCKGRTGFPIVDAAMRQLNETGYMHNRCRMITACFLCKDLLIDWRMGEKYFMEHLIDGDFASNNGGWGFSASTGVDPQPYFRIFNPLLQSEKFDPDGEYIRKWVEELRDVKGKAVHDPYGRGAAKEVEKKGYPRACVDHKVMREECLKRYKRGIGRETA